MQPIQRRTKRISRLLGRDINVASRNQAEDFFHAKMDKGKLAVEQYLENVNDRPSDARKQRKNKRYHYRQKLHNRCDERVVRYPDDTTELTP
jgi:hypothetical protein